MTARELARYFQRVRSIALVDGLRSSCRRVAPLLHKCNSSRAMLCVSTLHVPGTVFSIGTLTEHFAMCRASPQNRS